MSVLKHSVKGGPDLVDLVLLAVVDALGVGGSQAELRITEVSVSVHVM